jgi:hypothetical protein
MESDLAPGDGGGRAQAGAAPRAPTPTAAARGATAADDLAYFAEVEARLEDGPSGEESA